jgi:hypothetical protein
MGEGLPMHFPPFPCHWQVFGTAGSGQGRAVCGRRSEPLTAMAVLEHGREGKGAGGPGSGQQLPASSLTAMAELSPQDYIQSSVVPISIYEGNDHGPSASHQEVQMLRGLKTARGPIVSYLRIHIKLFKRDRENCRERWVSVLVPVEPVVQTRGLITTAFPGPSVHDNVHDVWF